MSKIIFNVLLFIMPLYLFIYFFVTPTLGYTPSDILRSAEIVNNEFGSMKSFSEIMQDINEFFPDIEDTPTGNGFIDTITYGFRLIANFLKVIVGIIVFMFKFIQYIFLYVVVFIRFLSGYYVYNPI